MTGPLLALMLTVGDAVAVTWTGDVACPQAAYRASLDAYLAGLADTEPLAVHASVRRDARARWTLTLTLDGADGRSTRTLHGASCTSVSEAAAFVTAVVVDPSVLDRAPPPADPVATQPPEEFAVPVIPEAPIPPPGPPPSTAVAEDPPPPPPIHPRRVRGFVRVAGGFEVLGAPRVGGQVQAAAGPWGPAWRAELRGLYRAPTAVDAAVAHTGARIGLWTVGAHGCGVLRPAMLEVPLCLGLEAGQVFGAAFGFDGARPARIPWVAAVASAALAWSPRPWLALWLGAELAVPWLGGSFGIGGGGQVHAVGPVSPRGLFGLELRFPTDRR